MAAARGFTLIEVLVAALVLAVGLLGLAAGTAALTRQLAQARRAVLVSAAAASRLERLHAAACGADTRADGSETVRRGAVPLARLDWTWTSLGDSTYRVRLVTTAAVAFARPLVRRDTLSLVVGCHG